MTVAPPRDTSTFANLESTGRARIAGRTLLRGGHWLV